MDINFKMRSCCKVSKHLLMSTLINQVTPFQPYLISLRAEWHDLPGRDPYDFSLNTFSRTGSSLVNKAPCTTLSIWDAIPRYRTPPFARGICTRLDGEGLNVWSLRSKCSFCNLLSDMSDFTSPSIPGLTLLFVRSSPYLRFSKLITSAYCISFLLSWLWFDESIFLPMGSGIKTLSSSFAIISFLHCSTFVLFII